MKSADRHPLRRGMALRPRAGLLLLFLLACGLAGGRAQESRMPRGTEDLLTTEQDRLRSPRPGSMQPTGVALESTIDPQSYFVGPSDVFSVNVWSGSSMSYQLTVTPEGTLIIPTVGEVRVADLTLVDAKARVVAEIRKRYATGNPTLTLVTPRPIVVTVTGNVLNPGSYILASYNRADKAVEMANEKRRENQPQWEIDNVLRSMSTRNIRITRKDGSVASADIPKFWATKQDAWNPYLREGDIVVVPRYDFSRDVVAVYGEVNGPGRFEYVRGDSVRDLLAIAYGFTPRAVADSVVLSRMDGRGEQATTRLLDGAGIMAGRVPDAALEPGDRLIVRGKPDQRGDYYVSVEGEVLYPGFYPITRRNTRLSEVIAAAGGFTEFASLKTAEVLRQAVQPGDIELERLESLRGGVVPDDSTYYYLETNLRIRKEIVNADFERLFTHGDSTQDILLREYDRVIVPAKKNTIYVFGQVVSPGHVKYVPGADVGHYLEAAGGFTERARDGDVKIVKAKTRQWLSPAETAVEEGDYVWVPKDPERPFGYYLNIVAQSAAVIGVALSLVLLVNQIGQ